MEGTQNVKIEKLKGMVNWIHFELEMKAVWVINGNWDVVVRRNKRPTAPPIPTKSTIGTHAEREQADDESIKRWKIDIKGWEGKDLAWETKNKKAIARLIFHTDDGPRQYIKSLATYFDQ